jgi:hypothetical protein
MCAVYACCNRSDSNADRARWLGTNVDIKVEAAAAEGDVEKAAADEADVDENPPNTDQHERPSASVGIKQRDRK